MLKTIALIASGFSALTAVTTSFRALGKSREYADRENKMLRRALFLYGMVTAIWFALSIIFALPLFVRDTAGISAVGISLRIVPFLFLFYLAASSICTKVGLYVSCK
jgi:hypothetical protein